jgi:porin
MNTRCALAAALAGAAAVQAGAQAPATAPAAAPPPASQPTATPNGPFSLSYSGDLWERRALTGDWGGLRNELSDKGIAFKMEVTQYLQGNARGGASTNHAIGYSGTADFALDFDSQRMGLWPGAFARVRGETAFGNGILSDVGAISAANFDSLLPLPNDPGLTTLTEYWIMQFVSPKLGFLLGQVDTSALPGGNVFATDRYGLFMNTAFWAPLNAFATVPYSTMTAGAFYMPTEWLSGATLVMDSYGLPTYSGFSSALHSPQAVTVLQTFTFNVKPFGRDGHQRINFTYSTRDKYALDDIDRLVLSGVAAPKFDRLWLGERVEVGGRSFRQRTIAARTALSRLIAPSQSSGDWAFWYDFDQFIHQDQADPKQGWGIFGRFGWSPGVYNPVGQYYCAGVGGTGLIPTRPRDRYGIGYYLMNLSNDLPGLYGANVEQGVEVFYNIEVTPWLHITPDIQVIVSPGGATGDNEREPAIVYGLRAQVSF